MEIKQCFKCKKIKPITEFRQYKSGRNKGYYFSYCKKCHQIIRKKWRKNNKEKCRQYDRKWRLIHPEYIKKYRKKNRASLKEIRKIYIEKNRDKVIECRRNYRHKLGISKKYRWEIKGFPPKYHRQKYKALFKGGGDLTIQTIQRVYEDNIKQFKTLTCYLCLDSILFGKDHLEHKIPLSRGGTNIRENLAIAHCSCNCKKHNKTEREFREEVLILCQ